MRYVFKATNFGEQDLGEPKRLRNDRKVKPSELRAKFAIFECSAEYVYYVSLTLKGILICIVVGYYLL
ncbi:MAG: hypothetical protein ICV54_11940 [Nostoc sp. C3-bin3]|nr:hypothetical protein [Nostoc sp. C3-bin3]